VIGLGTHALITGDNMIQITVTSATGVPRTYYITVTRAKSSDTSLVSLSIGDDMGSLSLTPNFNPAIHAYTVTPRANTTAVDIEATASSLLATITGTGSYSVHIGANTYSVTITAEDGTIDTYTIDIYRAPSTNAYLSFLEPSVGNLEPAFDRETTSYIMNLPDTEPIISFIATPEDFTATITGTGITVLSEGVTVITITVTAQDGTTTRDYFVTVNQQRTNEARLFSLEVDGQTLDPPFDPSTSHYAMTVAEDKFSLAPSEITAVPIDPAASLILAPTLDLSAFPSQALTRDYKIIVIAVDGFTTQEYIISVTRPAATLTTITSEVYDINRDDPNLEHIIGILPETTLTDFMDGLDNPNEQLKIFTSTGPIEVTNPTGLVGTGFTVSLVIDGVTHDELIIIVRADATGDSLVNAMDILLISNYLSSLRTISDTQFLASDVTKDEIVNAIDILRISNYLSGLSTAEGLNQ
jgi:hypothetical protein